MRNQGKNLIVVTHQAALLENLADEFVYMEAGRIRDRTPRLRAAAP
jgi:energy-coupling factor transporter ATP-binding protein EcfA2